MNQYFKCYFSVPTTAITPQRLVANFPMQKKKKKKSFFDLWIAINVGCVFGKTYASNSNNNYNNTHKADTS